MKKLALSLALAVFLFAAVGLAGGIGVASAHPDANPNFQGVHADDPSPSPVGKHLRGDVPGSPGADNGLEGDSSALDGLAHNPNCPLHHPENHP